MRFKQIFYISIFFIFFFLCFFGINAQADIKPAMDADAVDVVAPEADDLTKGLSDAEMEKALGDLSVADLSLLKQLIDQNAEYEYEAESFLRASEQLPAVIAHEKEKNRNTDEEEDVGQAETIMVDRLRIPFQIQEQDARISRNTIGKTKRVDHLQFPFQRLEQNTRTKRKNIEKPKLVGHMQLPLKSQDQNMRNKRDNIEKPNQSTVNEEYIKQLENSFPRDQEPNDQTGEEKKLHIRVKRDPSI